MIGDIKEINFQIKINRWCSPEFENLTTLTESDFVLENWFIRIDNKDEASGNEAQQSKCHQNENTCNRKRNKIPYQFTASILSRTLWWWGVNGEIFLEIAFAICYHRGQTEHYNGHTDSSSIFLGHINHFQTFTPYHLQSWPSGIVNHITEMIQVTVPSVWLII